MTIWLPSLGISIRSLWIPAGKHKQWVAACLLLPPASGKTFLSEMLQISPGNGSRGRSWGGVAQGLRLPPVVTGLGPAHTSEGLVRKNKHQRQKHKVYKLKCSYKMILPAFSSQLQRHLTNFHNERNVDPVKIMHEWTLGMIPKIRFLGAAPAKNKCKAMAHQKIHTFPCENLLPVMNSSYKMTTQAFTNLLWKILQANVSCPKMRRQHRERKHDSNVQILNCLES